MANDIDLSIAQGTLREYRFASYTPVFGPLIVRLRSAWYNMAARWGDQSIIRQQTSYNQAVTQRLAALDERAIQADRDLTNLTRTVAELTQQVIELRNVI
jgi:hypothetical protein